MSVAKSRLGFSIIGLRIAYSKYRNAKPTGAEAEKVESEPASLPAPYILKQIPENASRLQRIAHWLGLEDD